MRYAGIIWVLMVVLTPIIVVVNVLSNGVLRIFGVDPKKDYDQMTEEELRTIVDVSHESGVIEGDERKIIHMALQDNRRVSTYSAGDEPRRYVVIAPRRRRRRRDYDRENYGEE